MPTDHLACQYELYTICGAFDLFMHQAIMHVCTCRYNRFTLTVRSLVTVRVFFSAEELVKELLSSFNLLRLSSNALTFLSLSFTKTQRFCCSFKILCRVPCCSCNMATMPREMDERNGAYSCLGVCSSAECR